MTGEELYGRVLRESAAREGKRPLHLAGTAATAQAEAGARKQPRGQTGQQVREMAAKGMTLGQIADALGIAKMTVHKHARRRGIVLQKAER